VRQKSSQQKQTTQVWLVFNVEFNSLFMYLCVHGEKSDLLTWVIRQVLPDLVTYTQVFEFFKAGWQKAEPVLGCFTKQ